MVLNYHFSELLRVADSRKVIISIIIVQSYEKFPNYASI